MQDKASTNDLFISKIKKELNVNIHGSHSKMKNSYACELALEFEAMHACMNSNQFLFSFSLIHNNLYSLTSTELNMHSYHRLFIKFQLKFTTIVPYEVHGTKSRLGSFVEYRLILLLFHWLIEQKPSFQIMS